MPRVKGFTLIELVFVVIILGILVAIAVPVYNRAMERAKDQEAITNLKLIKAAELIFYSEHNAFFPSPLGQPPDTAWNNNEIALNTNLNLRLPTAMPLTWDYQVFNISSNTFSASAVRVAGGSRTYIITESTDEPTCSGPGCP